MGRQERQIETGDRAVITSGTGLQIEHRPVGDLIPYARNARQHSDAQVAQIAASIAEFGFTNPILADPEGRIIAGHGRLRAARELGLAEVPVIELAGLSEAQKKALRLADNKIALNAGWDLFSQSMLAATLITVPYRVLTALSELC